MRRLGVFLYLTLSCAFGGNAFALALNDTLNCHVSGAVYEMRMRCGNCSGYPAKQCYNGVGTGCAWCYNYHCRQNPPNATQACSQDTAARGCSSLTCSALLGSGWVITGSYCNGTAAWAVTEPTGQGCTVSWTCPQHERVIRTYCFGPLAYRDYGIEVPTCTNTWYISTYQGCDQASGYAVPPGSRISDFPAIPDSNRATACSVNPSGATCQGVGGPGNTSSCKYTTPEQTLTQRYIAGDAACAAAMPPYTALFYVRCGGVTQTIGGSTTETAMPLRVRKGSTTYYVSLVPEADTTNGSCVKIRTAAGVRRLRKI